MQSTLDVHIVRAQHRHVDAMVDIFTDSFDQDGSVKLMYTKSEIWPVVQAILHEHMDDDQIDFRLAMRRDSDLIVGWMSLGSITATGSVPEFAFNEMTSWAARKLLRGDTEDPRCRLAAALEERSRAGQRQQMRKDRLVINALVTDPAHRRRGVATTLLGYAMERTGSTEHAVWVQTPTVYEGLFWRCGFFDVGTFGFDLNLFVDNTAEDAAEGTFGVQTWRQMKLVCRAIRLRELVGAASCGGVGSSRGHPAVAGEVPPPPP